MSTISSSDVTTEHHHDNEYGNLFHVRATYSRPIASTKKIIEGTPQHSQAIQTDAITHPVARLSLNGHKPAEMPQELIRSIIHLTLSCEFYKPYETEARNLYALTALNLTRAMPWLADHIHHQVYYHFRQAVVEYGVVEFNYRTRKQRTVQQLGSLRGFVGDRVNDSRDMDAMDYFAGAGALGPALTRLNKQRQYLKMKAALECLIRWRREGEGNWCDGVGVEIEHEGLPYVAPLGKEGKL